MSSFEEIYGVSAQKAQLLNQAFGNYIAARVLFNTGCHEEALHLSADCMERIMKACLIGLEYSKKTENVIENSAHDLDSLRTNFGHDLIKLYNDIRKRNIVILTEELEENLHYMNRYHQEVRYPGLLKESITYLPKNMGELDKLFFELLMALNLEDHYFYRNRFAYLIFEEKTAKSNLFFINNPIFEEFKKNQTNKDKYLKFYPRQKLS